MKNEQVVQQFLDYETQIRHLSEQTVKLYQYSCRHWVEFARQHGVTDLFWADANVFIDWIDQRRLVDKLNERTVVRQFSAIRAFYDYVRAFHNLISPILQLPSLAAEPAAEKDFLSVKEVRGMLRTCRGRDATSRRNHLIIALLWCTGLRSRELHSLNWADIDLSNGMLLVRKGKGNKERQLFLCARLLTELSRFRRSVLGSERTPLICGLHRSGSRSPADGRLSQNALVGVVRDAAKAAGITRKVSPMTLRHTFATHMYEAGVPIRDIKEMMGHDNRSETGIYIHVTIDSMRDLLNRHAATRWLKEGSLV